MRILINLDKLQQDGVITPELAKTLQAYSIRDTGSTAINGLLAFGAILMGIGILVWLDSKEAAALISLIIFILGYGINTYYNTWAKLGNICMILATLIFSGATGLIINHPFFSPMLGTLILCVATVVTKSHLLISLVPFTLFAIIANNVKGTIDMSILVILFYSFLSLVAWNLAKKFKNPYQSLLITFTRINIILVNFGFWTASTFGDIASGGLYANSYLSSTMFSIYWLIALVSAGIWGAKRGRRFMVNTVMVFGAVHAFTHCIGLEWYPLSDIIAGAVCIVFGLFLWRYNQKALSAKNL